MKAATERKLIRWVHIIFSIPVLSYIYGPVASIPTAAFATRWVFLPVIILSGLWRWKGALGEKKEETTSTGSLICPPIYSWRVYPFNIF